MTTTAPLSLHPKLEWLNDVAAKPVAYLWPKRIPRGKLTIAVGDPGIGKGHIVVDLAARLSRHEATWPDDPTAAVPEGATLYLTTEDDSADTVKPRLLAAHGDPGRVAVKRLEAAISLGTDAGRHELEAMIASIPGIRLIVLDPLVSFIGKVDPWKDARVREVLDPLNQLAAKYGVGIIGIMHMTKDSERQALYRTGGSVAFVAAARAVYAVIADPDASERRLFGCIKLNNAPKPPVIAFRLVDGTPAGHVQWEEEIMGVTIEDSMAKLGKSTKPQKSPEGTQVARGAALIRLLLTDGPKPPQFVRQTLAAAGIASETTQDRAAEFVGVKKTYTGTAWIWELPPRPAAPAEGSW
jgi:putative DNA primase/helicase